MNKPTIASKTPTVVELDAGTHYWCSCGKSAFQPVAFTLEVKKRGALCNCKHSGNGPFCDGAHTKL